MHPGALCASLVGLLFSVAHRVPAQDTAVIFFDNSGEEAGITAPGTTDFSFRGSSWMGGTVATEGITPLYASGSFSYEIGASGGEVLFDIPVDSVEFFFVHGFGFSQGGATAFNSLGDLTGSVESRPATTFGDPSNFVLLNPVEPIARLQFTSGVIDNFAYISLPRERSSFRRGDFNGDGRTDIGDPIFSLNWQFRGGSGPSCLDAADANDDGRLDIGDTIWSLNHQFLGGPPPPAPGPLNCGTDPTSDGLGCDAFSPCQ